MYSIKLYGQKVLVKLDKDPLHVKHKNYAIKTVTVHIVYDLDDRPRNPLSNFKLKSCLFGARNVVILVYSSQPIRLNNFFSITINYQKWFFYEDLILKSLSFLTALLEMQSYSIKHKRIRRPGGPYLAIDQNGKIQSKVSTHKRNFFHAKSWTTFLADQGRKFPSTNRGWKTFIFSIVC